ncbi:ABC transporter substrate-binding protein [Thermosulfuriphilus sp.]
MSPLGHIWFSLIFLAMVLGPFAEAWPEISVVDDRGKMIVLKSPAQRIVSLYGAMTEIVFALKAGERLLGVTAHENWPPEVKSKTRIGTHLNPNIELILALKPDLVLQASIARGGQRAVAALERRGIAVAVFNPRDIPGVLNTIERVGQLLGRHKEALKLISEMKGRIEALETRVSKTKSRPRVFFEVSYPTLLAAGGKHIVSDLIRRAGGENVIKAPKKFLRTDIELILALDPDIYIVQKGPMNRNPGQIEKRPYFSRLRAVREGRVYRVDEFIFSRPGPRIVEALEELARILHPECFSPTP